MKKWTGPLKDVSIELPVDLHAAMKSAAPLRRLKVSAAYAEAATGWLSQATSLKLIHEETEHSARTYNPDAEFRELLDITGRLLRHPKPGLADTLRSSLVQLNDLARFWDGLQGSEDPPAREDQPPGDATGSAGLGEIERAAEEIERELREPLRSGTNPPGKARRDRKKDSSGG